jgi:hypothetical protein
MQRTRHMLACPEEVEPRCLLSVQPGSTIMLTGHFKTGEITEVQFVAVGSNFKTITEGASGVTATAIAATVPELVNPKTGDPEAGNARVTVLQWDKTREAKKVVLNRLSIANPGGPPPAKQPTLDNPSGTYETWYSFGTPVIEGQGTPPPTYTWTLVISYDKKDHDVTGSFSGTTGSASFDIPISGTYRLNVPVPGEPGFVYETLLSVSGNADGDSFSFVGNQSKNTALAAMTAELVVGSNVVPLVGHVFDWES